MTGRSSVVALFVKCGSYDYSVGICAAGDGVWVALFRTGVVIPSAATSASSVGWTVP